MDTRDARNRFDALVRLAGSKTAGGRVELAGRFYRIRRGRYVEIPKEWAARDNSKQKRRDRKSKRTHKAASMMNAYGYPVMGCDCPSHTRVPRERRDDERHPRRYGHPKTWAPRKTLGRDRLRGDEDE
jgi:hypothetical protein